MPREKPTYDAFLGNRGSGFPSSSCPPHKIPNSPAKRNNNC